MAAEEGKQLALAATRFLPFRDESCEIWSVVQKPFKCRANSGSRTSTAKGGISPTIERILIGPCFHQEGSRHRSRIRPFRPKDLCRLRQYHSSPPRYGESARRTWLRQSTAPAAKLSSRRTATSDQVISIRMSRISCDATNTTPYSDGAACRSNFSWQ